MEIAPIDCLQYNEKLSQHAHGIELYIFGSGATGDLESGEDLDILAIYQDVTQHDRFRAEAETLEPPRPLHLIAMTPGEEAHHRFLS